MVLQTADAATKQRVWDFLCKYGSGSLSYSALQEGMQWFIVPDVGFIQYEPMETIVHNAVCLGDPICAPENRERLLGEFIKKFHDPVFINISKETGKVLEKLGFYINQMGVETSIDVQKFTLSGSKKEFLRSQKNRAAKDGVTVVEVGKAHITAKDLKHISEEWMHRKTVHDHELSFLVRPAVFEDEPEVRKFVALRNNEVVAFVFFDPLWRDGKVFGYLANILRSLGEQSYSLTDVIIIEAIAQFKSEGIEELSLGLCPFFQVEDDSDFHHSKALTELYKYAYEHANHLYAFKSLAFHKERYRPDQPGARHIKVYGATKQALPLLSLYGVFRKMGIKPITQTAEHALECAEEMARGIPEDFRKLLQHFKHHQKPETT